MIFPVKERQKVPACEWKEWATTDSEKITEYWTKHPQANIGIVTGAASGIFAIDVDGEAGHDSFKALPFPKTLAQATHRGWHLIYKYPEAGIRNKIGIWPGVDVRGEGGYIVGAPSVHPSGHVYEWVDDMEIAQFPMELLTMTPKVSRPQVDIDARALAYLDRCPPAIQGSGGHNALLWAARCLTHGFKLSRAEAVEMLWNFFNPRCIPPWNRANKSEAKDFERKVDEAARLSFSKPLGWLLETEDAPPVIEQPKPPQKPAAKLEFDLRVPGFIDAYVEFCMKSAPYPNRFLAFCGAASLLSFLAARKIRDDAGILTNMYIIALAPSGAGKDWPRKMNKWILQQVDMTDGLGDRFASGEAIEDMLGDVGACLFQVDEIDSILRQMKDRATGESITGMLLTLYSESSTYHITRARAGTDVERQTINNPSLTLFCTAVPKHFFEALSERSMTNGFLSRSTIIDATIERKGQRATPVDEMPQHLVEYARQWKNYLPGGDCAIITPVPRTIKYNIEAREVIEEFARKCDAEYNAVKPDNEYARSVWARAAELARKMALLHQVSADWSSEFLKKPAAEWAVNFSYTHARLLILKADNMFAGSEFHLECNRVLEMIGTTGLSRSQILRRLRTVSSTRLTEILQTMVEQGLLTTVRSPTAGRPNITYHRCDNE